MKDRAYARFLEFSYLILLMHSFYKEVSLPGVLKTEANVEMVHSVNISLLYNVCLDEEWRADLMRIIIAE